MKGLSVFDLVIIIIYLIGMIWGGICFYRNNKKSDQFSKASGLIPVWAIDFSIYAAFLSTNTFLEVPGKAFGSRQAKNHEALPARLIGIAVIVWMTFSVVHSAFSLRVYCLQN